MKNNRNNTEPAAGGGMDTAPNGGLSARISLSVLIHCCIWTAVIVLLVVLLILGREDEPQDGSAGTGVPPAVSLEDEDPWMGGELVSDENSGTDSEKARAAAYVGAIEDLIARYGEGGLKGEGGYYTGLSTVRLIDFDGDGKKELFCAYNNADGQMTTNRYRVYGFSGGQLIELVPETEVYVHGTDYSPCTEFVIKDGRTHLRTCPETGSAWMDGDFLTLEGDRMVSVFSYVKHSDWWDDPEGSWEVNGESVDSDTCEQAIEDFYKNSVSDTIFYLGMFAETDDGEIEIQDDRRTDLEKTKDTIDHLRRVAETGVQDCPDVTMSAVRAITVSNSLESVGDRTYGGSNTIDKDPNTCWIVNTTEDGAAGAWIEYELAEERRVSGLKMINGNVYQDDYYFRNGHIKEFRLDFSDGSSMHFTAKEIESRSVEDNIFVFDAPVNTSWVRLTILSSYIGSKEAYRTNSAMAEIEFF